MLEKNVTVLDTANFHFKTPAPPPDSQAQRRAMSAWMHHPFFSLQSLMILIISLTLATIEPALPINMAHAEDAAVNMRVAILPFSIHSQSNIDYLTEGIDSMLTSRLAWKNRVVIAHTNEVKAAIKDLNRSVNANKSENEEIVLPDANALHAIASATTSDYVIYGSITEFAKAFSLDTAVFNAKTGDVRHFFSQAEALDQVISGVERVAAQINRDLFNRTTEALALIEEEKRVADEESRRDTVHANPEQLMQDNAFKEEKKRPFWKFWGKDDNEENESFSMKNGNAMPIPSSPDSSADAGDLASDDDIPLYPEIEPDPEEEESKPFWKFW